MKTRVTVLGDGGWGTALALLLHENGSAVTLWSAFPDYAKVLKRTRRNPNRVTFRPPCVRMKTFNDGCVSNRGL